MRLYRTANGRWVGLKSKMGKGGKAVEVPTIKADLIDFLNELTPPEPEASRHPACLQGRHDAELGRTANPYGSPDMAAEWARCYDATREAGLAKRQRFAALDLLPRNAGRPTRKRAKPASKKRCTTARCRANRGRSKGMLG